MEVLETPHTTGDRYVLRIIAEPGGPGIDGDFPHIHPILVETFQCLTGEMTARVGRSISRVEPGSKVEAPAGVVHGFLNTGNEPLVVDSEVIFPNGYRPDDDLLTFAASFNRLRENGDDPTFLQMAVLLRHNDHIMRQPGIVGWMMRPLALLGRLLGQEPEPIDLDGRRGSEPDADQVGDK